MTDRHKDTNNFLKNNKADKEDRTYKVTNPFSGQSEMLNLKELELYYMIKADEEKGRYELMQRGLTKFAKMNPDAYMTLLD